MKKRKKIILAVVLVLGLILFIGQFYLNTIIEKVVWQEVNAIIEEQKEDYKIEIGAVKVRFLLKRIVFHDVKVQSKDSNLIARDQHFDIDIEKLLFKVKTYTKVYNEGKLDLRLIELHKPTILLVKKKERGINEKEEKEVFKSEKLQAINISSFSIKNGNFKIFDLDEGVRELSNSGENVDFIIRDIVLDPNAKQFADRVAFKDLKINLEKLEFHRLKNHELIFNKLHYSNKRRGVSIKKASYKNTVPLNEFIELNSSGSTWKNIESSDIHFIVDFEKLGKKEVEIRSIEVGNLDFELLSIPKDRDSNEFKFENPLLKIPFPITLDSIAINNGKGWVKASEKQKQYHFKKLHLQAFSISNDSLYNSEHPEISIVAGSDLWENSKLKTHINWNQSKNKITGRINLDEFPEKEIIEQYDKYQIGELKSCRLDEIDIDFMLDSSRIQGESILRLKKLEGNYNGFEAHNKLDHIDFKTKNIALNLSFLKIRDQQMEILVDSLVFDAPDLKFSERKKSDLKSKTKSKKVNSNQPLININYFSINKASLSYFTNQQKEALLALKEFNFKDKFIVIDLSKKGIKSIVNTGSFDIEMVDFSYFKAPTEHFSLNSISALKSKNEIKLKGLRFKNKTSKNDFHNSAKEGNVWMSAYIEELIVKTDLKKILNKNISIDKIDIVKPILTYIKAIDRDEPAVEAKKKSNVDLDLPIYIKEIEITDADVDFRVKTNKKRESEFFDLSHLNGSIKNIDLNKETQNLRSSIYGKLNAEFYKKGKLNLDFQHSQRKRKAKTSLIGNVENIDLSIVREKLAVFKEFNFKTGSIRSIQFDATMEEQNVEGNLELDALLLNEIHVDENKKGDWFSVDLESASIHIKKDKEKALTSRSISLVNPLLDIHHPKKIASKTEEKRKKLIVGNDIFQKIASVDNLIVNGGRIRQFDGNDKLVPLTSVNNINVVGKNVIVYDSTNTTLPILLGGLDLELKNIIVHSLPHHDLTVSSLSLNLVNKTAKIKKLEFKNKEAPADFYKDKKYRKAWMDLLVPSMEIEVDLLEFFSLHPRIRKVNANDVTFYTYVNLALDVSPDEKPFPNRVLNNGKFPISVDSILVNNGRLDVQFHDVEKYGLLQFNDIQAKVSNLTTDKETMINNDVMKWVMDATMWETGDMHVEVDYKLNSTLDEFSMKGEVVDMELIDTDTLTKNLYGIKVNDGYMYEAKFDVSGNNEEASGKVSFDYEELKLSLDKKKKNIKSADEIKKTKKKDKLNESFVKSMVVNGLLRTKNTPEKGKYILSGDAYFKREKDKPIFHLMWYTLSSGLLEIAESQVVKDIRQLKEGFNFKKEKKE